MSGESRRKLDKQQLINELVEAVKKIDNDDSLQQFQRTKHYQRAAQKLRSRMYEDGRRSEDTKLSLMSYRRYLSDVRKALRSLGWKHHSLPKVVDRLARKHPDFKKELHRLISQDSEKMRRSHTELCQAAKAQYKATRLTKFRVAYDDFKKMYLDHDVLRHLAMQPTDKDDIADADKEALERKKTSTISVNYNWVLARINELTNSTQFGYQALGLALACGRRSVEILYQGRFKPVGENTVEFSGQAKERGGADHKTKYTIYTLIPAQDFCEKLKAFRKLEPVAALKQYDELPETQRNTEINRRTAKTLNTATKKIFGDDAAMFKWSRAIWARVVYTLHFEKDQQWQNTDEDIFWREMLGHDRDDTQQHYKYVKLSFEPIEDDYADEPEYTNKHGENIRVKRLLRLAKDYRVANRKALVKINEYLMQAINDEPTAKFTRSSVARELGSNRKAINEYFEMIEDSYGKMLEKPEIAAAKPTKEEADQAQPEKEEKPKKKAATKKAPAKKKTTKAKPKATAKKAKATK